MNEQLNVALFRERDRTKPAEQERLFRKFDVRRTSRTAKAGGKHNASTTVAKRKLPTPRNRPL